MGKKKERAKRRAYTPEYRLAAVKRMDAGECVSALNRELGVRRKLLYEWRARYRASGPAGLQRGPGRERVTAEERRRRLEEDKDRHIAELERKVGQQALLIDFLQKAFKQFGESRRSKSETGVTASTGGSGK
jgi:transposase